MWPFRRTHKAVQKLDREVEWLWQTVNSDAAQQSKLRTNIQDFDKELGSVWRAVWDVQQELGELVSAIVETLALAPEDVRDQVQDVLNSTELGQEIALRLDAATGNDLVVAGGEAFYGVDYTKDDIPF